MRLSSPTARRAALALMLCAASPAPAQEVAAPAPASAAPRELEPGAPPLATQRYRTGIEMYVRGDYAGAAREFKVAQALAPDSAKLAYNLARSLERAGDVPGAVAAYRHYLSVAPQAADREDVQRVLAVLEREAGPAPAPASSPPAGPELAAEAPAERPAENTDGLGARELGVWGLAAGAGAAAIVGAVFAVRAVDAKSAADGLSPAETRKHDRLRDTYETGQLGAGIGFGVAAALGLSAAALRFVF